VKRKQTKRPRNRQEFQKINMPRGKQALKRMNEASRIGTYNIHGKLDNDISQQEYALLQDLKRLKIKICSLQETKMKDDIDKRIAGYGRVINIAGRNNVRAQNWGLGFYIAEEWMHYPVSIRYINDRIAVLNVKMYKTKCLTVINAYAPTSKEAMNGNEQDIDAFYAILTKTYEEERNKAAVIFVCGDFNGRVGQQKDADAKVMGKHTKKGASRNVQGEKLVDFAKENSLILANTLFKKEDRKKASWHGTYTMHESEGHERVIIHVHNQIDYILIWQRQQRMLKDAAAVPREGMKWISDHSLVYAEAVIKPMIYLQRGQKKREQRLDISRMAYDEQLQNEYAESVKQKITTYTDNIKWIDQTAEDFGQPRTTLNEMYMVITGHILDTAKEKIPDRPRVLNGELRYDKDRELQGLKRERMQMRRKFLDMPRRHKDRRKAYHEQWKEINKRVKMRVQTMHDERLERIAKQLEDAKGSDKQFRTMKMLARQKRVPFKIQGRDGYEITTKAMVNEVADFYKRFFNDEDGAVGIDAFEGAPRPLRKPVTAAEVSGVLSLLGNNRAKGPDEIHGEYLKYGGEAVKEYIAWTANQIFERHEQLDATQESTLYPLNKAGKEPRAENTRPLAFQNAIRKVMSSLVLRRIQEKAEKYLNGNQYGFRPRRGTTEAVWTLQWMNATVLKYKEKYELQAIDLSKAFDCVKRDKLMEIIQQAEIVDGDERRMLIYLLSDTRIRVQIDDEHGDYFETTIGVPQGDALSPVLFVIYLEHIMREQKRRHPFRENKRDHVVQYADDTTFAYHHSKLADDHEEAMREACLCAKCAIAHTQTTLPVTMIEYKMIMNSAKTELETLSRAMQNVIKIKFLGTKINVSDEIVARISKAKLALRALRNVWKHHSIVRVELRVRLYKACVEPHLLYNTATVPARTTEMEQLNKEHRKGLRIALGVFYPNVINNIALYDSTSTEAINVRATKMRWELFGKILRGREDDPALRVMKEYYQEQNERPRYAGAPKTSIAVVLQTESAHAVSGMEEVVLGRLNTLLMLDSYCRVAQHPDKWKVLVEGVVRAIKQAWHTRESALYAIRAARKEQRAAGQENVRDDARQHDIDMICEGVRQLRISIWATRQVAVEEMRGLEAAAAAVALTDEVLEPEERQERRVRFSMREARQGS